MERPSTAGSPDKPQVRGGRGSCVVVHTPASNHSFLSCFLCILLSLCSTFSTCLFHVGRTSGILVLGQGSNTVRKLTVPTLCHGTIVVGHCLWHSLLSLNLLDSESDESCVRSKSSSLCRNCTITWQLACINSCLPSFCGFVAECTSQGEEAYASMD